MSKSGIGSEGDRVRRVRVLINPRAGTSTSLDGIISSLQKYWDIDGVDISYRLTRSAEDGQVKARRALAEHADTVLVVGGDGMVNSVGSELIGSRTALGVIPAGSGNGFARHFNIPLDPARAARALAGADRRGIDVGTANGRPFFVTCSMAWDAALVRTFERFPFRGVMPYVFAAVYELFGYSPQPFHLRVDGGESRLVEDPMVCTVANLTQFGGGARIAPRACPDDGRLELVIMQRKDWARLVGYLPRLFDGTLDHMPDVTWHRFKTLDVVRERPAPVQIDGELMEAGRELKIRVRPGALQVLTPVETSNRD